MTMRRDPAADRLDRDERELADQLARIAPRGEPSAELDARILAMAAGEVPAKRSNAPAARRRRTRWPVWLGVAASLTAVAGLVWRLEPLLHPVPSVRYEAPAPVTADTDPNGQRQPVQYVTADAAASAPTPPPPPVAETAIAPPAAPAPSARAARTAPAELAGGAEMAEAAPAPAPPAAPAAHSPSADDALVQEAPRRPTPEPVQPISRETAASIEPAARAKAVAADAAAPAPVASSPAPAPAMKPAAPPAPAPQEDRAGFDPRPPTTADDPQVQRAWLARIRGLRDGGQHEEARASLKAYLQRFPKADIPADLKPLLPASPPAPAAGG